MTMHWTSTLRALLMQGLPVVRMAIATVRGSAPREPGATLLYWQEADGRLQSSGSIGGGHLELRAMEIAGHLLGNAQASPQTERFTLGATLGQCCGGVVELFWERFDCVEQVDPLPLPGCRLSPLDAAASSHAGQAGVAGDVVNGVDAAIVTHEGNRYFVEYLADDATTLYLYGAGHVGKALVQVLSGLPFRLRWIDSRPGMGEGAATPVEEHDAPEDLAAQAPEHAWHLVMTHSHDEDFRICEALVAKSRFGFLGVIGSGTKQARFCSRLLQRGHAPAAVARMQSPIGVDGIASKLPAAIAVAVAAQLLQLREATARLGLTDVEVTRAGTQDASPSMAARPTQAERTTQAAKTAGTAKSAKSAKSAQFDKAPAARNA